ncbi:MAG: class I tRNA ligase family protein, partial [Verrucomicrobiota bacterium]
SRYRRAQGFNVLHPMGWDAFGLPAEQYAIKTGQHPRKTTEENIANFKRQIKSLGFSYDWSREVDTTDPKYFKWTQWIFLKIYNSWFNPETNKAEPIETLPIPSEFKTEADKRNFRDNHRLAYVAEAPVNWCEELGTVLANEEVIDGKSEVGGFPVVRKPMRQWMLRITAFAERLLNDLEGIDWSHSLKEMQRNWLGRSEGAIVDFKVAGKSEVIRVFTTRPDTLFGATYIVIAPESELADRIVEDKWSFDTSPAVKGTTLFGIEPKSPREALQLYRTYAASKSDLERTELSKKKTGVCIGARAINPVSGELVSVFVADYVLATYGTGAIMAVPAHDERDWEFAPEFRLPCRAVVMPPDDWLSKTVRSQSGNWFTEALTQVGLTNNFENRGEPALLETARKLYAINCAAFPVPFVGEGKSINSPSNSPDHHRHEQYEISISGLSTVEAKKKITDWLESKGLGKKTVNYKLRDWLFSRQRYWGEPFPIIWKRDANGPSGQPPCHEALPESALPLMPPELTDYKPAPGGEPPLARAKDWMNLPDGSVRETNTMPQWAGSCWYYLRYLDAQNPQSFVGNDVENYWMGAESPKAKVQSPKSADLGPETLDIGLKSTTPGVDLYVGGTEHAVLHLLYARFWHKVLFDLGYVSTPEPFFKLVNQGLILGEDGQKMSKSRGNVVNPDDVMGEYGADAFRLYEMFMGPLEMVKPWNTHGVAGVYKFLGRVWRLFVDEKSETEFEQAEATAETQSRGELLEKIQLSAAIKDVSASAPQLKTLHACIKKVTEDLDGLRFNTAISAMMVFVNDAIAWETKPASALRDFLILLQPFAPHLAEELWEKLNIEHPTSNTEQRIALAYANWPKFDAALLIENEIEIPIQVNGKLRDRLVVAADATQEQLEAAALASDKIKPFIDGKEIKKIVMVPKKLVNIVVA